MKKSILILFTIMFITFTACRNDDNISEDIDDEEEVLEEEELDRTDYSDWTELTHSNDVDPDYATVFNQSEVLRFDIEISSSDWSSMQSDLSSLFNTGGSRPGMTTSFDDPMWVKCSFKFNGKEWYNVGIRYKGNSSLQSAYQSGNNKLSFKLDFDEFEDDYPALKISVFMVLNSLI